MDKVWAPWRMEYLTDIRKTDPKTPCVFCEHYTSKDDQKNLVLHRGKSAFVIMNRYPYTNGHLMVIPSAHSGDLKDLSAAVQQEIFALTVLAMDVLKDKMHADGFNCGMNIGKVAGAGIPGHFHFHVVPRWAGDHNFFPIIAETKALPEYLEKTYDRLKSGF